MQEFTVWTLQSAMLPFIKNGWLGTEIYYENILLIHVPMVSPDWWIISCSSMSPAAFWYLLTCFPLSFWFCATWTFGVEFFFYDYIFTLLLSALYICVKFSCKAFFAMLSLVRFCLNELTCSSWCYMSRPDHFVGSTSVGRDQMLGHLDTVTYKTGISYSARLQTEPTDRSWFLGSYAAFK